MKLKVTRSQDMFEGVAPLFESKDDGCRVFVEHGGHAVELSLSNVGEIQIRALHDKNNASREVVILPAASNLVTVETRRYKNRKRR